MLSCYIGCHKLGICAAKPTYRTVESHAEYQNDNTKKRFSTVLWYIQAIMTVLLSLLSVSSRFACSGHSLRTRRRNDARATTGCKKKSSNLYTRRTILYIVPDLSISVQFRVCRHQPEPRVSPTLLPGQSQVTIEGRRATRLRTWPAWAARPARASRPGALRRSGVLEPLFPPFPAKSARPMCH